MNYVVFDRRWSLLQIFNIDKEKGVTRYLNRAIFKFDAISVEELRGMIVRDKYELQGMRTETENSIS